MTQLPLLPAAPPRVPGLTYLEAYVGEAESAALLADIDARPWIADWKRRVQRYGASYGNAASSGPIPSFLAAVAARLAEGGHLDGPAANVTINEYTPGQGIGAHRDYAPFGDATRSRP